MTKRETKRRSWMGTVGIWGAVATLLSSCEMLQPKDNPALKASNSLKQTIGVKKRPVLVARACYQVETRIAELAGRLGDLPESREGLVPMGNGSIEMGVQDADGRWIETMESGGTLVLAGQPGAGYRLVIRNRSRSPLELRVRVDGRDVLSGKASAWDHVGVELAPGETVFFDRQWMANGEEKLLTFSAVGGIDAIQDFSADGRTGLIQVGVFSLDREDRMRTAVPVPGWQGEAIPLVPRERPYQYR